MNKLYKEAMMSEVEPVLEKELVEVKAARVPVEPQPGEVRLERPVPKALTWLGPTLSFVGREIVPRLVASLLDAWDRRADRSTPLASQSTSERSIPLDSQSTSVPPVQRQATGLAAGRGHRHRRRQGRG